MDVFSADIHQDLEQKALECKQPQCWTKTVNRFADHLPHEPYERAASWTPAEAAGIADATEDEIEEVKREPFRVAVVNTCSWLVKEALQCAAEEAQLWLAYKGYRTAVQCRS